MSQSIFDLGLIAENWGDPGDAGYRMILGVFGPEAQALAAEMDRALANGYRAGLEDAAHSLKGAAANVGAVQLAALAGRLEALAPLADLPMLADALALLHGAVQAVDQVLAAGGPNANGT